MHLPSQSCHQFILKFSSIPIQNRRCILKKVPPAFLLKECPNGWWAHPIRARLRVSPWICTVLSVPATRHTQISVNLLHNSNSMKPSSRSFSKVQIGMQLIRLYLFTPTEEGHLPMKHFRLEAATPKKSFDVIHLPILSCLLNCLQDSFVQIQSLSLQVRLTHQVSNFVQKLMLHLSLVMHWNAHDFDFPLESHFRPPCILKRAMAIVCVGLTRSLSFIRHL